MKEQTLISLKENCFQLLRNVSEGVDSFNNHGKVEFSFTEEYKMDLSLTVAGYAIGQFEEMVRENAPLTIFERLREPFFINFESLFRSFMLVVVIGNAY